MKKSYLTITVTLMIPVIVLSACGESTSQRVENTSPTAVASPSNAPSPTQSPEATALPPHTISESSLGSGKRIQVDSNDPQLSRDDCLKLANNYAPSAGQGGQVFVQKPNPKSPYNGKLLPFCVDNLDGQGVTFNDFYFQ